MSSSPKVVVPAAEEAVVGEVGRGGSSRALGVQALRVQAMSVTLGGNRILREVSLAVRPSEIVAVIGPNGAGKSTLIRAITRVIRPDVVSADEGRVWIQDEPLETFSGLELAREVAVVQQLPVAPDSLTVRGLVSLGRHPHLRLLGRESAHDREVVRESMEQSGCLSLAERDLGTLSGGERRRAFIGRALAQEPRLMLLDEPTSSLDVDAQGEIFELLRSLARNGVAVLVVVHDLTLAAAYCDRLVLIDKGQVVASGTAREVLTLEQVQRVYGPHVTVLAHPTTGVPLVVPLVVSAKVEGWDG